MAYWRLITHQHCPDEVLNWYKSDGVIALGWGEIGELNAIVPANQDEVSELIADFNRNEPRPAPPAAVANGARSLWDFWQTMQIGDEVILVTKNSTRKCVVEITGNYFFEDFYPPYPYLKSCQLDGHYHRRGIKILSKNPNQLWKKLNVMPGSNIRFSLCQLTRP